MEHDQTEEPEELRTTYTMQLLPTRWSQSIDQSALDEDGARDATPRSIECQCEIIWPKMVNLPGRDGTVWPHLECFLEIVSVLSKRKGSDTNIQRDNTSGVVQYHKGWPPTEHDASSQADWLSINLGVDEVTFKDLWSRVTHHLYDEIIVAMEVTGLKPVRSFYESTQYEWRVEQLSTLPIRGFSIRVNQPAISDVGKTLRAIRARGDSSDDRPLSDVKEEVLKNALPDTNVLENHSYSQFNDIAYQIASSVQAYSVAQDEGAYAFATRLRDALDVLGSVRWAVNKASQGALLDRSDAAQGASAQAEHFVWAHGNLDRAFQEGYESEYHKYIDVPELCEQAAKYIQRPWMENRTLEWIMVDALIYAEILGFGESLKQHKQGGLLGLNWAYFDAAGNVNKMGWSSLKLALIKLATKAAVFVGLPIAGMYLAVRSGNEDAALLAGMVYFPLLLIVLLLRWLYWVFADKTPKTLVEKYWSLWRDMTSIYELLNPDQVVVHAGYLKDQLLTLAEKGSIWKGAIFALLDHTIQRDPALWVSPDRSGYRD